jgi:hypothetical protein
MKNKPNNKDKKMKSKKSVKRQIRQSTRYAILANKSYGLYAGLVESFNPVTGVAVVKECRHVARWYGKTGGITSLAAHGLCGPNASQSRIGAPVRAELTGIVNVFDCSPESRASIEAAPQS